MAHAPRPIGAAVQRMFCYDFLFTGRPLVAVCLVRVRNILRTLSTIVTACSCFDCSDVFLAYFFLLSFFPPRFFFREIPPPVRSRAHRWGGPCLPRRLRPPPSLPTCGKVYRKTNWFTGKLIGLPEKPTASGFAPQTPRLAGRRN